MTETAISPLRQRMIEDMTVRHFVEKTRTDYIRQVRSFAAFLGRSPDTASPEDVRRFQLHLTENGVSPPSRNAAVAALRFFFTVTLDRVDLARRLTLVHEPRKVPLVLSPVEVAHLLEAAPGPKYKAALSAAYGAGLRVSEVVSLKVCDIDSQRMLLRIEQGKGRKDRYAMLSPQLLELLRDWWRIARPPVWLFPGQNPVTPLTTRQLNRAFHAAAQQAGITKRVTPHTLRHSRLICADDSGVTFTWKDYWVEGRERCKTMALAIDEFIRRFLLHVLPRGFHRIRHYGLFAHGARATNLTRARELLGACEPRCETATADPAGATAPSSLTQPCPCCGGRMISIERFARGSSPAHRSSSPNAAIRVDTS